MLIIMINVLGKRLYLKIYLNLISTGTWYTFNAWFYHQTDGIVMEGPASLTTAELYMQDKIMNKLQYVRQYTAFR